MKFLKVMLLICLSFTLVSCNNNISNKSSNSNDMKLDNHNHTDHDDHEHDFQSTPSKFEDVPLNEAGVNIEEMNISLKDLQYNYEPDNNAVEIYINLVNNSDKTIDYIEFQGDILNKNNVITSDWFAYDCIAANESVEFVGVILLKEQVNKSNPFDDVYLKVKGIDFSNE